VAASMHMYKSGGLGAGRSSEVTDGSRKHYSHSYVSLFSYSVGPALTHYSRAKETGEMIFQLKRSCHFVTLSEFGEATGRKKLYSIHASRSVRFGCTRYGKRLSYVSG